MDEVDLRPLATVYLTAVHEGRPPTKAIRDAFRLGGYAAAGLVRQARLQGLLPPGIRGMATPRDGHWPRMAYFTNSTATWRACVACHLPWPCPQAATVEWLHRIERSDP